MKERGMIFNGEMVRAILDGRKTQTRRIVKSDCMDIGEKDDGTLWPWREHDNGGDYWYPCPFGEVGDRIWVRETFRLFDSSVECSCEDHCSCSCYHGKPLYRANGDDTDCRWTPSIHMTRWASRITLEITSVRVERLNDISQEDAQAEGMELTGWRPTYSDPDSGGEVWTPYDNFAQLWESIYGEESWRANPWVWVIEF